MYHKHKTASFATEPKHSLLLHVISDVSLNLHFLTVRTRASLVLQFLIDLTTVSYFNYRELSPIVHPSIWSTFQTPVLQKLKLLIDTYGGCSWLLRPPGITANCVFNSSTGRIFPPFLAICLHAVRKHPGCLTIHSVSTAAFHIRLSFLQHEHERKFIVEFHLWTWSSLWILTKEVLCTVSITGQTKSVVDFHVVRNYNRDNLCALLMFEILFDGALIGRWTSSILHLLPISKNILRCINHAFLKMQNLVLVPDWLSHFE
jgi:hypothetical protein